ncbi:MAG: NADH:ubiquinone oxidoreductase subunit NDUFA12 [Alphaproteobacteria bacterium]|nr:NADH:ubiquinone oxidoreductase subunit NDUFA12 [Alphaproteobacteria bacterium]
MATIGTHLYTIFFGKHVGQDHFGNRYYEERSAAKDRRRKRWVIYRGKAEASKVPAEWHGWLHYSTDAMPKSAGHRYAWQQKHLPNLTGTEYAYFPPGHERAGGARAKAAADYEPWQP